MDETHEIKVVTSAMSVDATCLDDILSAKVSVLVFRGFLSSAMNRVLIDDLERCAGSIKVSSYLNATLTTLGPYLAKYTTCPEEYFRQVGDVQSVLPKSLLDLRCRIYQWVKQWLQFETLKVAVEPLSGNYSGSVVRFHADGIANPLHNDNISRDAAGTGLAVTTVAKQLSCVVCLQACTSGGALRIYKKMWNAEDECHKNKCELGYSDAVVKGYGFCEFSPIAGDIYIFDPGYYHEIDRVCGSTRITLGFFIGLIDKSLKHALVWS